MITFESYSAVILDLDGVITDTRNLHYEAWKRTFDPFLKNYGQGPLSRKDYESHVDGKPREEGIKDFLLFRGIEISSEEMNRIGEEKNLFYLDELGKQGLVIFSDALRALKRWKSAGISLAVVSSSKNTTAILERLKIKSYFDVEVNAVLGGELHLKGKPNPDYFLEAARRLNVSPEDCIVVEDAVSGIEAGVKGHFRSVIGITRPDQTPRETLARAGADYVVSSLEEIFTLKPNVLKNWETFKEYINGKEIALFLDFDGTLSEIVQDYKDAKIVDAIRLVLRKSAESIKIAIISGRDRQDVKARVGLDNLFYAGCHGYDISGPGCFHFQVEEAEKSSGDMKKAASLISDLAQKYEGLLLEDKKYFTAVHYRKVDPSLHQEVKSRIVDIIQRFEHLEVKEGKMVIEIGPGLNWNKGEAVRKLCEVLELEPYHTVAVYVGDDLTDEDVFCELHSWGVGIKVGVENMDKTCADFSLKDPEEVGQFLGQIEYTFTRREKQWRRGA